MTQNIIELSAAELARHGIPRLDDVLAAITLNVINLSFLTVGVALHGTPARLMHAVQAATPSAMMPPRTMPMRTARLLCPQAIVVRGDHEQYSKYSNEVTDIIKNNVPLYEKSSIDEFYVDMTGMDKFFGAYKWLFKRLLIVI